MLDPRRIHAEGDHDRVRPHVHLIDEHSQQVQAAEVPAEQLRELGLGAAAEAARDRRPRGAPKRHVAHRVGAGSVAPRGQPREHPAERRLVQQIPAREQLVGGQRNLLVFGTHPRPLHSSERTAERDQPRLVSMPVRQSCPGHACRAGRRHA